MMWKKRKPYTRVDLFEIPEQAKLICDEIKSQKWGRCVCLCEYVCMEGHCQGMALK